MRSAVLFVFLTGVFFSYDVIAQEDLHDLFSEDSPESIYTIATFKSTRIINGQSVELVPASEMIFTVSHHFGKVNSGLKEFFGLDQSTVRLGLEYGIKDWLGINLGRSSFNKMVDGSVKVRVLRQQTGAKQIPLSAVFYSSVNINTMPWMHPQLDERFIHRIIYAHQLLLSRKFTSDFSLQIMPTLIHYNLVALESDHNDIPAIGIGGRYKFFPRFAVNAEYYFVPASYRKTDTDQSLSIGFDIETGGHVFQLFLTNSMAIYDPGFIAETYGKWSNADIYFGFNITRVFTLKKGF